MSDEKNCYAARFPEMPGYGAICAIDPAWAKSTAKDVADWIKRGAIVECVTSEEARVGMLAFLEAKK